MSEDILNHMLLKPPDRPSLKRSLSTHATRPGDRPQLVSPFQLLQQEEQPPIPAHRTSRRSVSAERTARWVAAPHPKPRTERWVALPFPAGGTGTLVEEDEDLMDLLPDSISREASGTFSPTPAAALLESAASQGVRGRILVVTACESFNRQAVWDALKTALPYCVLNKHPEVVHMEGCSEEVLMDRRTSVTEGMCLEPGDVFIFDYGVVICWGLEEPVQDYVLRVLRPCQVKSLPPGQVQREQLAFHYTADQPPHIKNDCITISKRDACDSRVKMAISHALAQSTKLSVYETRVSTLIDSVRHLPESLAKHGEIRMSRQKMAKIKGQVFIIKSEVNLLSTVLDTPDFFWSAPDALKTLYTKVCEYNDLQSRIDLVNSRTMLIQSMMHIWSDDKAHHHLVRLDRVVIILIVAEVIIAAAEVLGFFLGRK